MGDKNFGEVFRDCLSCKCGEERHDVQYGQTRLALTFITINLVAAALGLNFLASESKDDETVTLGRGAFTSITTFDKLPLPGSENNSTFAKNAQVVQEFDFDDGSTCDDVDELLDIDDNACEDIISATNVFIAMGVLATILFAIIFAMLLRIECRQLCSRPMRQVLLGLMSVGWIFTFVAWVVILGSPIPNTFDTLGTSVWIMILASVSSLVCIVVSILDYRGAGGGPAPAAKYS